MSANQLDVHKQYEKDKILRALKRYCYLKQICSNVLPELCDQILDTADQTAYPFMWISSFRDHPIMVSQLCEKFGESQEP